MLEPSQFLTAKLGEAVRWNRNLIVDRWKVRIGVQLIIIERRLIQHQRNGVFWPAGHLNGESEMSILDRDPYDRKFANASVDGFKRSAALIKARKNLLGFVA